MNSEYVEEETLSLDFKMCEVMLLIVSNKLRSAFIKSYYCHEIMTFTKLITDVNKIKTNKDIILFYFLIEIKIIVF